MGESNNNNNNNVFELPAIVIDNGSGVLRAGFAGDDAPRSEFPSYIGRPKYPLMMIGTAKKSSYVGKEASLHRGVLSLHYAIKNGGTTNWEDMESVWHNTFYPELGIDPREHAVLISEPSFNSSVNREKTLQIMFENFEVPCLYMAMSGVLAMYASGKTTGIVLDIGDGVTQSVPIYDGYLIKHAVRRLDLAGRDLTNYLARIMVERGYAFTTSAEMDIMKDIKEKLAYVAFDFETEMETSVTSNSLDCTYELPDGQVITIGNERFRCSEVLFEPSFVGSQSTGIHEIIHESITDCDMDIRKSMYENIILSGGTTLLSGIDKRLEKELIKLAPTSMKPNIVAVQDKRNYLPWIGGSILGSLTNFKDAWMTMDEYNEYGPGHVHVKFKGITS